MAVACGALGPLVLEVLPVGALPELTLPSLQGSVDTYQPSPVVLISLYR